MTKFKNTTYGGIIRNSLFERSSNPGETYNINEILSPADEETEILLNDMDELTVSAKEVYAALMA